MIKGNVELNGTSRISGDIIIEGKIIVDGDIRIRGTGTIRVKEETMKERYNKLKDYVIKKIKEKCNII